MIFYHTKSSFRKRALRMGGWCDFWLIFPEILSENLRHPHENLENPETNSYLLRKRLFSIFNKFLSLNFEKKHRVMIACEVVQMASVPPFKEITILTLGPRRDTIISGTPWIPYFCCRTVTDPKKFEHLKIRAPQKIWKNHLEKVKNWTGEKLNVSYWVGK